MQYQNLKKGSILENLKIEGIAFGGEGIAKIPTERGDFVLFIKNTLPGQVVRAKVIKKKHRFAHCKLHKVQQPSPDEISIPYQTIPGAPFARFPISKQKQYKQESTLGMFKRISGIEHLDNLFESYISSPEVWHYRNKMEYSFSSLVSDLETEEETQGFALGSKRRGQWWAVEQLNKDSGLFDSVFENALTKIRQFCETSGLPAWNPAQGKGFFRFLVVRKSYHSNQLLINLLTTSKDAENFNRKEFITLLQHLLGERLAGIWHTFHDGLGDVAKQPFGKAELIYGQAKITERILDLEFDISMQSFFQTNPKCAELLYSKVVDYVKEGQNEEANQIAMDLFCGTGIIAQLLASGTPIRKVIGVDIVPKAIEDAKKNAEKNNIDGVEFYLADVRKFLYDYPQYKGKIQTVVLDPPRAGIVPKVLKRVIELAAKQIVYVSCNPSTQARDTVTLAQAGYELKKFCLVDQFPHTAHIESIALYSSNRF